MPRDEVTARPIGDRYALRGLLGRGGMGSVWRGEDLLLQRPVAVKRVELPLHLPDADRAALRERVLREARAAARVSHPRIVTIFDVVEEDGTVFLVQELVDAPTLKAVVAERGPLPVAEVAAIGAQLVEGLAAAHRNGVVHRDVKPSNVMVLPDGSVKLADFGIASLHGDPQLTATGVVIGSPAYMAPEQAVGDRVGAPADLWSAGATLYFAVEGQPPFGRADTLATLTAVVNEPPRPTVAAGPLAPLLTRLLAKSPADRPAADEVVRALAAAASGADATLVMGGTGATRRLEPPAATTVAAPVRERTTVAGTRAPAPPRARRGLGVAIAVVVVLLLGGFALAGMLGGDGDRAADRAATPTTAAEAAPETTAAPPTTAPPPTTEPRAAGGVPDGWKTHTNDDTGYRISHPPSWKVRSPGGNRTDFVDPATGTYLRVDWTDEPKGSAQEDWKRQSKAFGSRREGYEEISITPTRFAGSDNASLWEYRYREGGATFHAYNLGFVTRRGDPFGFALNFQTREEQWAGSQELWEQLKAGFRPPTEDD